MIVVARFGPAGDAQWGAATVPGATIINFALAGSNNNQQLAETWASFEGGEKRYVPGMLRSKGIDPAGVDDLFIGSFSAGHGAVKKMLMGDADRAAVTAVMLADSTYSDWADAAHTVAVAPEGYVRFAMDCLREPKLFVATAGPTATAPYPTGWQTMDATRAEIEARAGRAFETASALPSSVSPQPDHWAGQLGSTLFAEYGSIAHAEHATLLAPQLWQQILVPWLQGGRRSLSGGVALAGMGGPAVPFLLGAAVGWAAARLVLRQPVFRL
jgi:hypothetical protein